MTKKRKTVEVAPEVKELFARVLLKLKPPPKLTVSEWADKYRRMSPEASAGTGRWHTDNAPYQRAVMDAIGDPHIRMVVVKTSSQIGKTEIILNTLGYAIDYTPAPTLVMQPTVEMGQTFSKDRLAPMIRDTPELRKRSMPRAASPGIRSCRKHFRVDTSPSLEQTARRGLHPDRSSLFWQTRWTDIRHRLAPRATR